jgi:hypothetical protein
LGQNNESCIRCPHSATKIAPNKANKDNEVQVLMNISKRAKKGTVTHKQHKGYKDSFSMEMHKVEDKNRGLHTVDGSLHPR